jgi:hypothetical protein
MILILSAGAAPLLPAEAPTPWVARLDRPAQWRPWPGAVLNHLVAVAPDGSTAVTGSPAYDYLTVVYDRDGAERWRAGFDGGTGSFDFPTALAVDSGGRVTVTGASYTEDFTRESWDIGTVQYAPDGSELWRAVYDGPGAQSDFPAAVAARSSSPAPPT